jgi:hypothetical protein
VGPIIDPADKTRGALADQAPTGGTDGGAPVQSDHIRATTPLSRAQFDAGSVKSQSSAPLAQNLQRGGGSP